MEDKKGDAVDFFNQLWSLAMDKHNQGVYNTVCLAVLLALPLLVVLTSLAVCCHYCCCRRHADGGGGGGCCCCSRRHRRHAPTVAPKSDTKRKKNRENTEDLWISVTAGQMTPDRITMAMV